MLRPAWQASDSAVSRGHLIASWPLAMALITLSLSSTYGSWTVKFLTNTYQSPHPILQMRKLRIREIT